jgi:hypothetical protein
MRIYSMLCFFAIAIVSGCSTAKVRVMPGENGVNKVMVRDINRDGAEEAAVKAANEYCEKKKMEAVFVNNKTQYTGKMDEETRNNIKKASTAAMILGGVGSVNQGTQTPGAVLGTAGTVGHVMTSDRDYQSDVEFKCK